MTTSDYPRILPVEPGTLSSGDRDALRKAGVVVIEHPAPGTLRLLRPTVEVDGGDMLCAAMQALASGSTGGQDANRTKFVLLLTEALSRRAALRGEEGS